MLVLVRELKNTAASTRRERAIPRHSTTRARCASYHRLQEMGGHHPYHHTGRPKRHSARPALRLPVEAHEPHRQGQARKRVPTTNRSTHARE